MAHSHTRHDRTNPRVPNPTADKWRRSVLMSPALAGIPTANNDPTNGINDAEPSNWAENRNPFVPEPATRSRKGGR